MKKRNREKNNCYICGDHIDKSACDNQYLIITDVNCRTIPVTNKRFYICENCRQKVINKIELNKLDNIIINIDNALQ